MMILFLSFLTCTAGVFCLRRAVGGEPTVQLVRAAPRPVLMEAVEMLEDDYVPDEADEFGGGGAAGDFLRGFTASMMSLTWLSLMEVGLTAYFLATMPGLPVVWYLALKSAIILYWLPRHLFESAGSVLRAVAELPDQVVRWKRIGDFISFVCFLVLFLIVNQVIPYGG
jgi:hypothetical protein